MVQRNGNSNGHRNGGNSAVTEQYHTKLEGLSNKLAKVTSDEQGRECVDSSKSLVVEILTDMKGSKRTNEERKSVLDSLKKHTGNLSQMAKTHKGSQGHKFFGPVITELQNGQSALATLVGPGEWSNQGDPSGPAEADAFEEWEESEEETTDEEGHGRKKGAATAGGETPTGRIDSGLLIPSSGPTPRGLWYQWSKSEDVDDDEAVLLQGDDGASREMLEDGEGDIMRRKLLKVAGQSARSGTLLNPDMIAEIASSTKFRKIAPNPLQYFGHRLWNLVHLALLCVAATAITLLVQGAHTKRFDAIVKETNEVQVNILERLERTEWKLRFGAQTPIQVGEEAIRDFKEGATENAEVLNEALLSKAHDPLLKTQASWPAHFNLYDRTARTTGTTGRGNGAGGLGGGSGATQRIVRLTNQSNSPLCTAAAVDVKPDLASGSVVLPPVRDEELLLHEGCSLANGFESVARRSVSGHVLHLPATKDYTGRDMAVAGTQIGGPGGLGMVVEYGLDYARLDSYRTNWETNAIRFTVFGVGLGFILSLLLVEALVTFLPVDKLNPLVSGTVIGTSVGLLSTLCLLVGAFVSWDTATTALLSHELQCTDSTAVTLGAAFNIHYAQFGNQITNKTFVEGTLGFDFPFSTAALQPLREVASLGNFEAQVYDAQGILLASTVDVASSSYQGSKEKAALVAAHLGTSRAMYYDDLESTTSRNLMFCAADEDSGTTTFVFKTISLVDKYDANVQQAAVEASGVLVACFLLTTLIGLFFISAAAKVHVKSPHHKLDASASGSSMPEETHLSADERSAFAMSTAGVRKLTTSAMVMSQWTMKTIPLVIYVCLILSIGATAIGLAVSSREALHRQAFEAYKGFALPQAALLGGVMEWAETSGVDSSGVAQALAANQPTHSEILVFTRDDTMLYPRGGHEVRHLDSGTPLWVQSTLSAGTRRGAARLRTTVPSNGSFDKFPSQSYTSRDQVVSTSWTGEKVVVVQERVASSIDLEHENFTSVFVIMCMAAGGLGLTIFLLELLFRWMVLLRFELKGDLEFADQWCDENSLSDTFDILDTRNEYGASVKKRMTVATILALLLAILPALTLSLSLIPVRDNLKMGSTTLFHRELADMTPMLGTFLKTMHRELQQRNDISAGDFLSGVGASADKAMHSSGGVLLHWVLAQQQKDNETGSYSHRVLNTGGRFKVGEVLSAKLLPSVTAASTLTEPTQILISPPAQRIAQGGYQDMHFCSQALVFSDELHSSGDAESVFHIVLMFDAVPLKAQLETEEIASIDSVFQASSVTSLLLGVLFIMAGVNGFFKARLVRDAPVSEGRRRNVRVLATALCIFPVIILLSIILTRVATLEQSSADLFRNALSNENQITNRRAVVAHGLGAVKVAVKAIVASDSGSSDTLQNQRLSVDPAWFTSTVSAASYTSYLTTLIQNLDPLMGIRVQMGEADSAEVLSADLFSSARIESANRIINPLKTLLQSLRTESECLTRVNSTNTTLLRLHALATNKISQVLSLRQQQQTVENIILALLGGAEDIKTREGDPTASTVGTNVAIERLDSYAVFLHDKQAPLLDALMADLSAYIADPWVSTDGVSCQPASAITNRKENLQAVLSATQNANLVPVLSGHSAARSAAEARLAGTPLVSKLLYYNQRRGVEAFNCTTQDGFENIASLLAQAAPHLHLFLDQLFQLDGQEQRTRVVATGGRSLILPSMAEVQTHVRTSEADIQAAGIGCVVLLGALVLLILLHTAILDPSRPKQQVAALGLGGLLALVLCLVMAFGASRVLFDYLERAEKLSFAGVDRSVGSLDGEVRSLDQLSQAATFWNDGVNFDLKVVGAEGIANLALADVALDENYVPRQKIGRSLESVITITEQMRQVNSQDLRYAQQGDVDAYLLLVEKLLSEASDMHKEEVEQMEDLREKVYSIADDAVKGWWPVTTKMSQLATLVVEDFLGTRNATMQSWSPSDSFFSTTSPGGDGFNQHWIPEIRHISTMGPHNNQTTLYSLSNDVLFEKALLLEDSTNYNLTAALLSYHATVDLGLAAVEFEDLAWSQLIRGFKLSHAELALPSSRIAQYNDSTFAAILDSVSFASATEKATALATFSSGITQIQTVLSNGATAFAAETHNNNNGSSSNMTYVTQANHSTDAVGQGATANANVSAIANALLILGYVAEEATDSSTRSTTDSWSRTWLPQQYDLVKNFTAGWTVDLSPNRPVLEELIVADDIHSSYPSLKRDSLCSLATEVISSKVLYRATPAEFLQAALSKEQLTVPKVTTVTTSAVNATTVSSGRSDDVFHALLNEADTKFNIPRRVEEWLGIVAGWSLALVVTCLYYRQRRVANVSL